jgi:hypothetical protein
VLAPKLYFSTTGLNIHMIKQAAGNNGYNCGRGRQETEVSTRHDYMDERKLMT